MILLDTDILSHFLFAKPTIVAQVENAVEEPAITIVSRIEVLAGRFDSVLKATDGKQLMIAQERLQLGEKGLARFGVVKFDANAAAEFDRLRQMRNLKKIGRADIMIASIALAHRATLVTRNLRHFRQFPGLILENWLD